MNIVQQVKQMLQVNPQFACVPTAYTKEIPISQVAEGLRIKDESLATWEASVEAGKASMAGESITMQEYLRKYTGPMSLWYEAAYDWAAQNPGSILVVKLLIPKEDFWEEITMIGKHGEYVVFYIENSTGGQIWISRDNETRVLVYRD